MIFEFPSFHKISLTHRGLIESLIEKHPPFSDFTFTSLWTYNTEDHIEFSILNDNFVVKFQDYITNAPFYSFIGSKKPIHTALTLLDYSIQNGLEPILKLIPQSVIHLDPAVQHQLDVTEDLNNHDYIISAKDLALLDKVKYDKKGYLVRRFGRKYPDHVVKKLDLSDHSTQEDMKRLFHTWENVTNHNQEDTKNEFDAFSRMLTSSKILNIYGTGIYIHEKMIAFTTYEKVHQGYGMALFEKADKTYKDIYTAICFAGAKHLHELGVTHINFEQDLGIEGLRAAKSLWKPTHFLKKYIISPKK
jgi:hypothetical protein